MRSYQVAEFGSALAAATKSPPKPTGAEVLLKVAACGVCHSDVHLRDGYFDLGADGKLDLSRGLSLPFTLGHEVAGEVVALGPDAAAGPDAIAVGDRRVVYPWIGCGQCSQCADGRENLCRAPRNIGVQCDGGYSDHVFVPHARYLLPFGDVPVEEACTYACSGLTAYSALRKIGRLTDEDPLVVIGAGGVGLAGVRLARHVSGVPPIVAEIEASRRDAAVAAGAREAIDPAAEGAARALIRATGGGAAAAVDFVGSAESARFGFDILRKGGKLVIVGLFGGGLTVPVPHFPLREVTIAGSYVGSLEEMRDLLGLARDGKVGSPMVEARPLDEAETALSELKAGRITGRAVLVP